MHGQDCCLPPGRAGGCQAYSLLDPDGLVSEWTMEVGGEAAAARLLVVRVMGAREDCSPHVRKQLDCRHPMLSGSFSRVCSVPALAHTCHGASQPTGRVWVCFTRVRLRHT